MDYVVTSLGEPMKQDYDKKDITASPETKVEKDKERFPRGLAVLRKAWCTLHIRP